MLNDRELGDFLLRVSTADIEEAEHMIGDSSPKCLHGWIKDVCSGYAVTGWSRGRGGAVEAIGGFSVEQDYPTVWRAWMLAAKSATAKDVMRLARKGMKVLRAVTEGMDDAVYVFIDTTPEHIGINIVKKLGFTECEVIIPDDNPKTLFVRHVLVSTPKRFDPQSVASAEAKVEELCRR